MNNSCLFHGRGADAIMFIASAPVHIDLFLEESINNLSLYSAKAVSARKLQHFIY